MNLQELQQWVAEDWAKRSNGLPTPEQQILFVLEELGEVAEAIRKSHGNKDRVQKSTDIGSEIADVLISLITLANTYETDLTQEVEQFQKRLLERHNQGF